MNLPNLSCYAKLASNWPATKIKLKYQKRKRIIESFLNLLKK